MKVVLDERVTYEVGLQLKWSCPLGQILSNVYPPGSVTNFISRCGKMFDAGWCLTKLKGQYWHAENQVCYFHAEIAMRHPETSVNL